MVEARWINPAFHRHPIEATIIGRILAAFGEIELELCRTCARGIGPEIPVLRTLYRVRMTSQRLDVAYNLAAPLFTQYGLAEWWMATYSMVKRCLQIRNQFAHCNWGDHPPDLSTGLFFADLGDAANDTLDFDYQFRHVDAALLDEQERFFATAHDWIRFADHELAVKQGRLKSHFWPRPQEQALPPLHNPPLEHVPPWLNEDQKARHLARALAAQGGAPTPTPGQQALDKARAEKRAQREAHREASLKGRSEKPREGKP